MTKTDLIREAARLHDVVGKDPADASARYRYGRVLIALDQPVPALSSLKKATELDQHNVEYLFWLGIAYGANKRIFEEQTSYARVLQIDPKHVQALVRLGNSYLEMKKFQPSLNCYQRVLQIEPDNAYALYNKAVIYKQLHRRSEEKSAWRSYLDFHHDGALAKKAVEHLNLLGDFSYRNHHIGYRTLTLPAITFAPLTAELTQADRKNLDHVGSVASNLKKWPLDVLVYAKDNEDLAHTRAISIKRYLEKKFPALASGNLIRISWFNVPEKRKIGSGRFVEITESTVFFLTIVPEKPSNLHFQNKKKR